MRKADASAEQPEIDRKKDRDEADTLVSRALWGNSDEKGRCPEQEPRWIGDDVRIAEAQQVFRQKHGSRGQRPPVGLGDLSAEPGRRRGRDGGQQGKALPDNKNPPIVQRRQGEEPEDDDGDC